MSCQLKQLFGGGSSSNANSDCYSPGWGKCPGAVIPSMNGDRKEQFELEQYSNDILCRLNELRHNSLMCDVTIKIEHSGVKKKFSAHKLVLAASSPYFKAMFAGGCKEKNSSEVSMTNYIHPEVFSRILDFVYTSRIQISEKCVLHIMSGASMLQMNHVVKICEKFLESQLDPSNCIGLASFACELGCQELKKKIEKYICDYFDEVSQSEEFKSLNVCQISKVVSNDKLNVKCESQVYTAVTRWVRHDYHNRKQYFTMLVAAVRCHSLTPKFISWQIKNCPMLSDDDKTRNHLVQILDDLTVHNYVDRKPRQPDIPQALYVVGGYLRNSLITVECYLPSHRSWMKLRNLPMPRSGLACCVIQGLVYVIGGRNNTLESSLDLATCERYNPMSNQWDACKSMSVPRNRVGVGVIDNEMYAVGGSKGTDHQNTVEKYSPTEDAWQTCASMKTSRIGVGCAVANRMLYAVGGFDGRHRLSSVERYHPENNEWCFVQSMLTPRSGAGVVSVGKYIYAIGGYDGKEQLNSVERYNIRENCWVKVASMKHRRSALTVAVYDKKIYAIGGYDGSVFLSSIECLDPGECHGGVWREVAEMSSGRSGCGSVVGYQPCLPQPERPTAQSGRSKFRVSRH